jgi:hypothetical protein
MLFHKRREQKLQAEDHAELRQKLGEVTDADGVISVDGFRALVDFVGDRQIDPGMAKDVRIALAQGGVFLPSEQTALILKKDETSLLDTPVNLLKEVADRELRGRSQGFSVPIGGIELERCAVTWLRLGTTGLSPTRGS